MNAKRILWLAFAIVLVLPSLYPVRAQVLVTSCTYSPDGGAWAWAQVSSPPGTVPGAGWAKMISYKGPNAHAWFWVLNNVGVWILAGEHAFTGSGQSWTISKSLTGGVYGAHMQAYDGNSNVYMGTADALALQSGPSPPCNGPQNLCP